MPKTLTPSVNQDVINPYSGGAWLYLCEIAVPTQSTQFLARNTEDVVYDTQRYTKANVDIGDRVFSGDASIPRVTLRVHQDAGKEIERIVNDTFGALNGTVKVIKVGEKFLAPPIAALEADYDILAAESDTEWVTFTLGIPNPLTQKIPLETYSSSSCRYATPSLFKGCMCQYTGADTSCTGAYDDCRTKGNAVHWGGQIGLDPNGMKI